MIAGEGRILTAGAIDSHVHLLSPSQLHEALGDRDHHDRRVAGPGRARGRRRPLSRPAPGISSRCIAPRRRARSTSCCSARETRSAPKGLPSRRSQARPATKCTRIGVRPPPRSTPRCARPTTGASRSPCMRTVSTRPGSSSRRSARSRAGRSTRSTSRAPAVGMRRTSSRSRRHPHVIPGSTNPTLPHTVNTVAEHLDMLMVCHHLSPDVPEDLAFAESRIRATTIAAEDILHDLGALSITSSDAQAMGRIGEVITRTWQVAHVMKARRGRLDGGLPADNERARRYVAKYTINPAIAHGIDHVVGSVEVGQAGRSRAVGSRVLRGAAAARDQGRRDRVGRARRSERVDPDAAAGADAAVVRGCDRGGSVGLVRLAGRARRRAGRAAGVASPAPRRTADALDREGAT